VPFITTPDDVVERMLEMAGTRADDFVVDLGSGDGRIVITAARKYGARGLGIELDDKLVQASRENARRAAVAERVHFVQGDVLLTDFSRASVVTVYLLPELIGQLQTRFVDQLKPGTRIVSHSFGMAGWRPDRSMTMKVTKPHAGQGDESSLYLWIVPANVRGSWSVDGRRVRIEQDYQQLDVEGATQAHMSGGDVSWQWPDGRFQGRVEGNRIVGELAGKAVVLTRR
jgi:protein-L-isoaspartate O-methyltransferase